MVTIIDYLYWSYNILVVVSVVWAASVLLKGVFWKVGQ